jgi:hypothetical protein
MDKVQNKPNSFVTLCTLDRGDFSKEHVASIFRNKEWGKQETRNRSKQAEVFPNFTALKQFSASAVRNSNPAEYVLLLLTIPYGCYYRL